MMSDVPKVNPVPPPPPPGPLPAPPTSIGGPLGSMGIGGSVAVIIVWALGNMHVTVPGEVAGAFTAVLSAGIHWAATTFFGGKS
jgi:hypothetical protein